MIAKYVREIASESTVLTRALAEIESEWAPESVPSTVALGAMGRAFAAASGVSSTPEIDGVCSAVEDAMTSGEAHVADEVATGFLEALLQHPDTPGLNLVTSRLRPKSRAYCRAWDEFTGVRTPGLWDE